MRRDSLYYATVVTCLFGFADPSCAFVSTQQVYHRAEITPLHLVPGQGNQLAAYNAANYKNEKNDDDDIDDVEEEEFKFIPTISVEQTAEPAARSFVQRAFNLPSNKIRRHPHPKAEWVETSPPTSDEKDVVLYPVLGFTFCRNGDRVVALPTTSNVSCRLPTRSSKHEELYGWFSPVCKLDMYSEDPCHPPEAKANDS